MSLAIKTLEEIGENTSIKQHDCLVDMLDSLHVKDRTLVEISTINNDLVCGLLPADDKDDKDDKDKDKDDKGDKGDKDGGEE
jgi:hypothetical protein